MAVRIPVYNQQTTPEGLLRVSVNPEKIMPAYDQNAGMIGHAIAGMGHAMQVGASEYATEEEKQANSQAAARVGEGLMKAHQQFAVEGLDQAMKSAPPGASGFTKTFMAGFEEFASKSLENEQNEHGKALLSQGFLRLGEHLQEKAYTFESKSRVALTNSQLDDQIQTGSKVVYQDPSQYDSVVKQVKTTIANMPDLTAPEKIDLLQKRLPEIAQYATLGFINQDPKGAYETLKQDDAYSPGLEGALKFTFKHEGGLNPADTNGTPSNFGINQKAHPEVDVTKLTKDQAAQIYKKDYWDKIGGDKLAAQDPKLAMAVFDTAVIAGVPKAKALLNQSGGDPSKYMELRADYQNSLLKEDPGKYGKYANAWASRNRELRNQLLPDGMPHMTGKSFVDDLSVEKAWTYKNIADTRNRQTLAVEAQTFKSNLDNSISMFKDGKIDPNPLQRDQFISTFGEEEGLRQYQEYANIQQMGHDINSMQSMPTDQIMESLKNNEPKPGAGYKEADARYGIMSQAAVRTMKAREDDPSAYVLKTSKPVQDAYTAFQNAPPEIKGAAAVAYVDASLAEQKRLGMPTTQILTKPFIEGIKGQFAAAKNGEQMQETVNGLKQTWDKYWPVVNKELVKEKVLPPTAMVASAHATGQFANDVYAASAMKDEDILKTIPDANTVKKDVEAEVATALQPIRDTMIGADGKAMNNGGIETFSSLYDVTRQTALYYVARGIPPKQAAMQAAEGLATSHYKFVPENGPYRVPVGIDADAVNQGANAILNHLSESNVLPAHTVRMDSNVGSDFLASLKNNAYWVTNGDETGLTLYNAETRRAIMGSSGKPIGYTWDQLAQGSSADARYAGPDLKDIRIDPTSVDQSTWDKRADGSSKGTGFLGLLKRPDGSVSSEISVGVNIGGKEMDIPTLVPTLTRKEVDTLLNLHGDEKIPEPIIRKAVGFARKRISEGKSVFAGPEDLVHGSAFGSGPFFQ